MKRFLLFIIPLISTSDINAQSDTERRGYISSQGFVPDKETAIKIAEAIWLPIYGEAIYDELPFQARLLGDSVWVITGTRTIHIDGYTLSSDTTINGKFYTVSGGVLYARFRKLDCKIIEVSHGK